MAVRDSASHDLLLSLFALADGKVDQEQLVRVARTLARAPDLSLADLLVSQGHLDPKTLAQLEARIHRELATSSTIHVSGPLAGHSPRQDEPTDTVDYHESRPPHREMDSSEHRTGQTLNRGRYEILRSEARGGLGEVFIAFDTELNRQVAVKELHAGRSHDPDSQTRFLFEAEVTGSLEHPGIVPVHSLSRHPDGRPYYAMRLLDGGTLREAIKRFHRGEERTDRRESQDLAFRRLLRSIIDACNAVGYAHSRGVVHRDLKPENIMLGRFGETLVVDWGLAKLYQGVESEPAATRPEVPSPDDPSMTRPGSVIGTPRYMSPEQAAGDLDRVGPASDLYSLGAILYCVLVGHDAFPDGNTTTVLDRVCRGIFPAPRRLRRSIDPSLEATCLKAMSLDPRSRHASALDLADEIEKWLSDVRYRAEQESGHNRVMDSLARLSIERAHTRLARGAKGEAMLWLSRALEEVPPEPPELPQAIRTSLSAWHTGAKLLERRFRHGSEIHAVAFCPAGRKLATAGSDQTVRLWDLATGSSLCPPLGHDGPVRAVAFHPDGHRFATAGDECQIRLWDALTGESVRKPIPCGSQVTSLIFNPEGSRIAVSTKQGGSFLWDTESGKAIGSLAGQAGSILAVAFSLDGSSLAVACPNGDVLLIDSRTGATLGTPFVHDSAVKLLTFDTSGERLLTASHDGSARLWEIAGRDAVVTLDRREEIRFVAFQPGGSGFATSGVDGTARLRDGATGQPLGERLEHDSRVECLAFRPDGTMLATGGQDGKVRLWCATTGLPIGPPLENGKAVRCLSFSRDGGRLVSCGPDATARCWATPNPIEASAERVSYWVRLITNLEFDEADAIRQMDAPTSWDLRRCLDDLGGPPPSANSRRLAEPHIG